MSDEEDVEDGDDEDLDDDDVGDDYEVLSDLLGCGYHIDPLSSAQKVRRCRRASAT